MNSLRLLATTAALLAAAPASAQLPIRPLTVKPVEAALSGPLKTTIHRWTVGSPPVLLPPTATHFCVLGEISGKFAGYGERVALTIDKGAAGGPRWTLWGESMQSQLTASAICAPKNQFALMTSDGSQMTVGAHNPGIQSECNYRMFVPKAPATHAYFLGGMAGKFNGDGEEIIVMEKLPGIETRACSGAVEGRAVSFGSDKEPPKYRTPTGRTTDAGKARVLAAEYIKGDGFTGTPPSGYHASRNTEFLAPADEALCGLTMVRGKFQGYGERASIGQIKGSDGHIWWALFASSAAKGSGVTAGARCFARDQR